jgi:hypothetical protein
LSQSPKRPGARDISDLKARLGLKKGGPTAKHAGGAPSGVVPPPGLRLPGGVPAPPGARPPQPAAPSVADDPFGAMNMLAAQGAAARAASGPEIVVIDTSGPVESVEEKVGWLRHAKLALVVLAPLAVGVAIGQISNSAKSYNETIRDADRLAKDVKKVRDSLVEVQNVLLLAKERGAGGQAFLANDDKLTDGLAQLELADAEPAFAFSSSLYKMEAGLVKQTFEFYVYSHKLYEDIRSHVATARIDSRAMADGKKRRAAGDPGAESGGLIPYRYGVYLEIPKPEEARAGRPAAAKVIELGSPICADRKTAPSGRCPDGPPIGFGSRENPSEGWALRELAMYDGETLQGNKILPIFPSVMFESMLKGSEAAVSEVDYLRRVRDLEERVTTLIAIGSEVESKLRAKANEGQRFTFFM